MKKLILFMSLTLLTIVSYAQNSTDELTTRFFEIFKTNTDDAFDFIFGENKWMASNSDGIEKLKFQLREASNLMGEFIGFEKLNEKSLGDSYKVCVFIVKYDRQPLRFVFKFYKAKTNWVIYNLKFDEELDDEIK